MCLVPFLVLLILHESHLCSPGSWIGVTQSLYHDAGARSTRDSAAAASFHGAAARGSRRAAAGVALHGGVGDLHRGLF